MVFYTNDADDSLSQVLKIDSNKLATFAGNVTAPQFIATSDKIYKKDIKTVENPTSIIKKMRGVSYIWKENFTEDRSKQYGVVAQELEDVLPDSVVSTGNGKAVNYNHIVGVLIEGFKEQQKEIDSRIGSISPDRSSLQRLASGSNYSTAV